MKNTITTIPNLAESISAMGQFKKSRTITGNDIGVINNATLISVETRIWREAYHLIAVYHDNDLSATPIPNADKEPLYGAIRDLFTMLGPVNGHPLMVNDAVATMAMTMACKTVNVAHDRCEVAESERKNYRKRLNEYMKAPNGVNPDAIKECHDAIEALNAEIKDLEQIPGMKTVEFTRVAFNAFRGDFEHYMADVINGQLAKSSEQLDAEEAARKEARKQAKKAKAAAKKAAVVEVVEAPAEKIEK